MGEIFEDKGGETAFMGTLQNGCIFGEIGFLMGDPSEIEVVASTDLRAKRLSRNKFLDVLGEDGQKFLRKMADTDMTRHGEMCQSLKHEFASEPPRRENSYSHVIERAASNHVLPDTTLPTAD